MTRRVRDCRPMEHHESLTLSPQRPLRLLPKHGQPFCVIEWISQTLIKLLADPFVYATIVVVLVYVAWTLTA